MITIPPKKSLGQNFLINEGIIAKIITAAELTAEDTVLEVGPGTGNLTRAIVETGARVIAVEKDHRIIEDLNAEFSAVQIEIIEGDIIKFKPTASGLAEGEYKIVANLPYYITSHFIRTVFESASWRMVQPSLLVLMVQKEVAQRIIAKPPDMNLLALSIQYYAKPEIIIYVSKGSFRPMPTVDSAVIKLIPKSRHPLSVEKEELFFRVIRTAFAGKRKQLMNTLPHALPHYDKDSLSALLTQAGIEPEARPETVDLAHWLILLNSL